MSALAAVHTPGLNNENSLGYEAHRGQQDPKGVRNSVSLCAESFSL